MSDSENDADFCIPESPPDDQVDSRLKRRRSGRRASPKDAANVIEIEASTENDSDAGDLPAHNASLQPPPFDGDGDTNAAQDNVTPPSEINGSPGGNREST